MPPITRKTCGVSALTASEAQRTLPEKVFHSESISKVQRGLLFGSFQNFTASILLFVVTEPL